VAGAYVLSNFGEPRYQAQSAAVIAAETTSRVAIAVVDQNENGLEDWRDEFIDTEPIVIETLPEIDYQPPETLTGQFGLNLIESSLLSQTYGPVGRNQEQIANDAIDVLEQVTRNDLYDTPDITIMRDWEDQNIRTYANTLALAIINNNITDSQGEMYILNEMLQEDAPNRVAELEALSTTYRNMRDLALTTPVPAFLTKEHLDLVNTYDAIYHDISAMTEANDDPVVTLLRLKRYEDDATGLGLALENMYNALLPYASLIQPDDPALLFVSFSPDFN